MRICLSSAYDQAWIAGFYYVVNLIRALRGLPENEQPELVLMVSKAGEDLCVQEGITGLVDSCVFVLPLPQDGTKSSLTALAKQSVRKILDTLSPRGDLKALIQRYMDKSLERMLQQDRISLLFPCLRSMGADFPVPWLPWIPDLQHKHYPDFFTKNELKSRDVCFTRVGRDASGIVFSSQVCLDDFDRFFPGYKSKLRVLNFRTVPDPAWFEINALATIDKLDLPERFFMAPNQFWAHKNHRVVFEAMKILSDRGVKINLVCTGSTSDYRNRDYFRNLSDYIERSGISSRVIILGFIPRLEQIQIMRRCLAVIQPSLFEGWSTVVEDARCLGKRVLLSDIPVHREQQLPGAVFFDPADAEQLADAIRAEWGGLEPSASNDNEAAARERQAQLVNNYARQFIGLARELVTSRR